MDLVGREGELQTLVGRLRERRLVTVIGPGGIGKTALARVAAAQLADDFDHGSHTVDLTRVSRPEEVGDAVAAQLGYPSLGALLDAPTDHPVLLVVDNCEHVSDAAADVVARILDACSAPTVLATSRSPLDLPGEAVVALGPLDLPPPGVVDVTADAVRLFVERARDAGCRIGDDDLEPVCELCRRLDGVPLAIEIAAARSRSLTPAETLAHLAGRIDVLSRPRHRGAARHRSLRAAIEWSYRLLDEPDAALFDRLGVFTGPFTLEAAHAVGAGAGAPEAETLDRLDQLVASSLVLAEPDGDVTRYRLLETLRAFALDRLDGRGELAETSERLVDHAVAVARSIASGARTWQAAALARLVAVHETLAAAARWCLGHDDEPDRALLLLTVMWGVVHQVRTEQVADLGEQVLARWPDADQPLWADAAATVATARYLLGRGEEAVALAERALAAPGRSLVAPVAARRVLALASRANGELDDARHLFGAAAAEARSRDLHAMAVELDTFAAEVAADLGCPAEALAELRRCEDDARRLGSDVLLAWVGAVEGHVLVRSDPHAALPVIEAALAASRRIGYRSGTAAALSALALQRLSVAKPSDAAASALELLDHVTSTGAAGQLGSALTVSAAVLRQLDSPRWADVAATAATVPARGGLAREVPADLRPPVPPGARALPVRDAVRLARAVLKDHVAGVAPASPAAVAAAPAPASAEPRRAVFRRTGDLWEVEFAERGAHLRPSKGMDDLARLLARPGREIHCMELVGAAVEQASTGAVIDAEARRAYEQRVRDLQAEADEAEADHDLARAERARVELDAVVDQLTAALGIGGKARRGSDTAERARSAVTQRIRAAVRRIGEVHPRLGRHLEASVRTGTYCCYEPEQPVDWVTSSRGGTADR